MIKKLKNGEIDINNIKIQDIELPADMKKAMARQAEAEGEKIAAINLAAKN
ncbi:MAG: hypothetical protein N3D10_01475 [Candidatus Micrarchaeota archaeon]|nr:hypothetical protein [Candidatus Micrarchaeota archaeon]